MGKYFNIAGPCFPSEHYMLPALDRMPETPWATPEGLDMPGLMAAFQAFWLENSGADRHVHDYDEAVAPLENTQRKWNLA